jgi:hypothetical protein
MSAQAMSSKGMSGLESRQVIRERGPARYVLVSPPNDEPDLCRYCGADIVQSEGRWYALESRWPNPKPQPLPLLGS